MCDLRNHNLRTIYVADNGWNEEHVVRWCEDCGAVVVDRESDNRRFGKIMKMKFPKILYQLRTKSPEFLYSFMGISEEQKNGRR
jgi:hypothetical protein